MVQSDMPVYYPWPLPHDGAAHLFLVEDVQRALKNEAGQLFATDESTRMEVAHRDATCTLGKYVSSAVGL